MSELRPKHITAAIADIMAATATAPRPVGTSTAHRIRATLRSALTDAVKERLIDFNPAQHAELPTASRPKGWNGPRHEPARSGPNANASPSTRRSRARSRG